MEYNTQQRRLPLPEYGRSVQNMVDHALTITDREERQHCAQTIINIMGNMFTHLRDVPDFKHKLWDHLAIMADFKLDIDYPYEVVKKENLNSRPQSLSYPDTRIRYRHYGRMLEKLIQKLSDYDEGEEKKHLIMLVANQMKKNFQAWNKEVIDDKKIFEDLSYYSKGTIQLTEETIRLGDSSHHPRNNQQRNNTNYKPRMNGNGTNNNGYRKYK